MIDDYRATVAAWLTVLGIDPKDVPDDSDLYITTETGEPPTLHYEAYLRNADGNRYRGQDDRPVREQRTVPLTVEPPAIWRPHRKPTREALIAAVEAVRKLHQPAPDSIGGLSLNVGNRCAGCGECYRCPTIRALDALERS